MKWILKRLIYLVMFGGVLLVPLALLTVNSSSGEASNSSKDGDGILDSLGSWFSDTGQSISSFFRGDQNEVATINDASMTTPDPDGLSPHLDGGVFSGIDQILDFDITPSAITNRWARVSFHVREDGFHSYRVPVVTGEEKDDLAGSLTYLFNENEQLQRIEFLGYTKNIDTLVRVMKHKFSMTRRPSPIQALYVKSQNKLPVSALRVIHPDVVKTSANSTTYEIRFELNRLHLGATLSDSFRRILATDRRRDQI